VARAGDTPPALRDLAAVVALWLDEMRRAEASGRRAQTKAREDEARVALIEARLRDMEKRAQDAEKKLEALRAIERDLSGRGTANGRP
jgi:predicted RNase H-like nuclease (RuvC/YqgF family)